MRFPNHLLLLWSKARVVSEKEKPGNDPGEVCIKEANESEGLLDASKGELREKPGCQINPGN